LQQGTNVTITDNGNGTVTINASGGGGGGDDVATEFNVNHTVATGNPYLVGDRVYYNGNVYQCIANNDALLPTNAAYWLLLGPGFRLRQTPVDWNATSGDFQVLNKPTIPAAQVNSDWDATSGVAEILNKPTIPAAQVNSDWDAVSGLAEILNKPTIPENLDDLGDVNAPSPTNGQVLAFNSTSGDWEPITPTSGGSVTSVGLTMPSAFNVSGSPVTTAGTLAVTGAGNTGQYIRGDGTLANFPSTGGGGGQIFYFNGNIAQPSIGGNNYFQLGTNANTGPAANFTRATTGILARFITDVGSPNHLIIPSGVWTVDVYLSETGGGSNNAEILAKLFTYNGSTFTLIATSTVEQITNGNVPDLYTFSISVPSTVTAETDRVYIEFDIQNTNGKTVTLYTEGNKIGEVHTTYAIGLSSLNGLTANTQNFATGTAGTDFGISSSGSTHTFNLPTASAANRGALSKEDWATFNAKADLASPAFTGTPTAPTATAGTNNTQLATTAFVQSTISGGASVPSYTMKANNTGASAVATDQAFRFNGWQTFNTTLNPITYGSPPTTPVGAGTFLYNWTRIGNTVNFTFYFALTTGINLTTGSTQFTWTLPSDMPTPFTPTGISGTNFIHRIFMTAANGLAATGIQATMSGGLQVGSTFMFTSHTTVTGMRLFSITSTYFTS
jgi:hypothetical protein